MVCRGGVEKQPWIVQGGDKRVPRPHFTGANFAGDQQRGELDGTGGTRGAVIVQLGLQMGGSWLKIFMSLGYRG